MILNNIPDINVDGLPALRVYSNRELVWGLPKGYKRCKYLEFSGIQRFNTLVQLNADDIVISLSKNNGFGNYNTIWGAYSSAELYYSKVENENVGMYYGAATIESISTSGSYTKVICKIVNNSTYPYWIGDYGSNRTAYMLRGKIYGFYIMREAEAVMRLVPCVDAENTPCFFDTVSYSALYEYNKTGVCGYELMDGTYVAPI